MPPPVYPIFTIIDQIPNPYQQSNDLRLKEITHYGGWQLTPLYKFNVYGALMIWYVCYDIKSQSLILVHGQNGSVNIQIDYSRVDVNKSGRNLHEQSLSEARSKYNDKYKTEGYRPAGESPPVNKEPMTAETWDPDEIILEYPVAVQPKIDGIRCVVTTMGNNVTYTSRSNNEFSHLKSQFDNEILSLLSKIPYNVVLDGELYVHGLSFQKVASIIKNEKTLHTSINQLVYCIFTFNITEPFSFEVRHKILANAFNNLVEEGNIPKRLVLLDTRICLDKQDVLLMHEYYKSLKFEGTMIYKMAGVNPTLKRLKDSLYDHKRSNNLLKYKDFIEEEALVVGVTDGGKGREHDSAKLILKDLNGRYEITVRPAENLKLRKQWLINPLLIIGKLVTIKYQELTDKGIPRFPRAKSVRNYE